VRGEGSGKRARLDRQQEREFKKSNKRERELIQPRFHVVVGIRRCSRDRGTWRQCRVHVTKRLRLTTVTHAACYSAATLMDPKARLQRKGYELSADVAQIVHAATQTGGVDKGSLVAKSL
jgi:hypothetical protein